MNSLAPSWKKKDKVFGRFALKKRRRVKKGEMHSVIYALVGGDNDGACKKVGRLVSWFFTERYGQVRERVN